MHDNELQIILTLIDKASADLKKVMGEAGKDTDTFKKKSEEATNKTSEGFKKSAAQARTFRRDLLLVVGTITAVVAATREYAKYNKEAQKSVDEFDLSVQEMSINAGRSLIPVIKVLSMAADGWAKISDLAANVASGKGFFLSDQEDINNIIIAGQELKNIAETQKQIDLMFLTGKTSANDYFKSLSDSGFLLQTERMNQLNFYKENYLTAHATMKAFTLELAQSIKTNLGTALTGVITGAQSAKEAFTAFGKAMLEAIVNFMVQKVIAFTLEKTLLAGSVAAATAATAASVASAGIAGPAIAAAFGPAAVAANIASFGMAGVAAAKSAILTGVATGTAMGFARAAAGPGLAEGTDSVPAMLTPGEMVIPRSFAQAIRQGDLSLSGRDGGSFGDINIFIQGGINSAGASINEMAEQLGFAFEREVRTARGF